MRSEVCKIESLVQLLGTQLDELVTRAQVSSSSECYQDVVALKGKLEVARARLLVAITKLSN